VLPPEITLGEKGVVRAAKQPKVVEAARTTEGKGMLVMNLETRALAATVTTRILERAATQIALPNCASESDRYITSPDHGPSTRAL
jgi:hypothetical protein